MVEYKPIKKDNITRTLKSDNKTTNHWKSEIIKVGMYDFERIWKEVDDESKI